MTSRLIQVQIERLIASLRVTCGADIIDVLSLPELEDLACNPDGSVWIKERSGDWRRHSEIDEFRAYEIVTSVAAIKGRDINASCPVLETTFPLDCSRFEAVVPPVTERATFCLRKVRKSGRRIAVYMSSDVLTDRSDPANARCARESFIGKWAGQPHGEILMAAVMARKNIVFAGPPGSGKTSFADAVCTEIGALTPEDRVICIEDTPEMSCDAPNVVGLLTNDSVDLLKCVRTAMRLRASRIVVGEARGAEAYPLLKGWMTGHPGGLATVHADSGYGGLLRLEALACEAAETTASQVRRLIAQTVDLVVYIEADKRVAAGRKVKELLAIKGWDGKNRKYEVELI